MWLVLPQTTLLAEVPDSQMGPLLAVLGRSRSRYGINLFDTTLRSFPEVLEANAEQKMVTVLLPPVTVFQFQNYSSYFS
jgi:hypothetical protein